MILSTDSSKEFPWIEVIYSCRNLWLFFVQIKTKVRTQFWVENFEGSVTWKTANMDGWMVVTGCVEGIILKKLTAVVQNGVRPVSFCSGAELSEGNHHRFNAHEGSCTVFIFRNFVLRNCILFLVVTVGWEEPVSSIRTPKMESADSPKRWKSSVRLHYVTILTWRETA